TLTMMFEGVMHHVDSTGFRETLPSGSTQNMRAGSGIRHGGDMAADPASNVFHEVQLWVTTPSVHKMDAPSINTAQPGEMPIIDRGDHRIEIVTGNVDGVTSPLTTTQPTRVLHVTAEGGARIEVDAIDSAWNALIYVLRGSIVVGGRTLEKFTMVAYDHDGDTVAATAGDAGVELLVLTGLPTGEPIAMGGPWVMNTRDELAQADEDFRAGKF
ncbi:MAG: pirin-like C-terminal cupin domain-containing protein, partial [Acidimicrobiia bacterium]|nr:pirin-like C-terminal cupin domain-containing protein [Acidimicrobiia bacterium]